MQTQKLITFLVISLLLNTKIMAQQTPLKNNYLGFMPAILAEPYDTINAVEVNFLPLVYELRMRENNDFAFQIRPIANYRFHKNQSGFSQIGGTLVAMKYFLNWFEDDFWLIPTVGAYGTYAYNRLDKIQTITLGVEPGAFMAINNYFSMSLNIQPGINYYPDSSSKEYVGTKSGFKAHFGVFFHIGYNF